MHLKSDFIANTAGIEKQPDNHYFLKAASMAWGKYLSENAVERELVKVFFFF